MADAKRPYQITVQKPVLKQMRFIPPVVLGHVRERIAALADDPVPAQAEPIQGYKGYFRIRIGSYRVIYEVAHTIRIITIVRIAHRKDVYRNL